MKTPDAAIHAWWEIAGNTWWGSSLKAAVWSSPDSRCWYDSAQPLHGGAPYDLTITFPVKLEGVFPRSKDKTDAVPKKDSGEDPSSKKRAAPVQDVRPVQKRCTSSIRNAAISCPPFERSLAQRSPPPPYTSPVNRENEGRGRRIRKAGNGTRQGHNHTAIPEVAVDDHVKATTNV
ncbi:MAG: hypothetical protein L6R36_000932 [Xanthoria steineri]|nr:MAG: hypothetical protein L6R36_000932 [Xanthoria steineri]